MRTTLVLLLLATPALAQTPQSGAAAPSRAPSGQLTPAPVPEVAPGVPATGSTTVVPEQVAPPAETAGPANATPFSNTPSGLGDNQPGKTTPSLSR